MAAFRCGLCAYLYDEEQESTPWDNLPDDWTCPVCGSPKSAFSAVEAEATSASPLSSPEPDDYLAQWRRPADDREVHMADIHTMALTGESIIEPMRTPLPTVSWDEILIKGAQLARLPLDDEAEVRTRTVIGPGARHPMVIETPVYVTHMSYGALSREAKTALARGSAAMQTAMCSGEGGILEESLKSSHRYVFEYVPNKYSVTDEYLRRVDAVEIKIGQSAKPGMGGHLPGSKVTPEIAKVRGRPVGQDIISPSHFPDITTPGELRSLVDGLRQRTGGKPIGVKIAAGHVEEDLRFILEAGPDFVTIDGRAGATGAAPKLVKRATSMPTIYALHRARRYLDDHHGGNISLLITGGLRVSPDFAKALAMGADAIAIGTAAMMAIGCQQYRICDTGKCPVGIASQDPVLRARLDIDRSAQGLANFLRASTEELRTFARLTGNSDVHGLATADLLTTSSEIATHTNIQHA